MYNVKSIILLIIILQVIHYSASQNVDANLRLISHSRIIGGKKVRNGSIPYFALLIISNKRNEQLLCGGSLITRKFVLTAAQCLKSRLTAEVGLGAIKTEQINLSEIYMISRKFCVHEDYDDERKLNDIGLIELPYSVEFSKTVAAVTLPSKSDSKNFYTGYNATLYGLGRNIFRPLVLQSADATVVEDKQCDRFDYRRSIMICVLLRTAHKISSNGDSGSPLIIKKSKNTVIQIGLVSFGEPDYPKGISSVYTRVSAFLNWIKQNSDYKIV